jgi:hypothetical protein
VSRLATLSLCGFWFALVSVRLPFVGGPYQGADWRDMFEPAARAVLGLQVPYGVIPGALHPIPLYWLLGWVALVPVGASCGALVALSCLAVGFAASEFAEDSAGTALAVLASPFFMVTVLLGQIAALEVLALALIYRGLRGYWLMGGASLLLALAMPPHLLPIGAWLAAQDKKARVAGLVLVGGALVLSLLLYGEWITPFLQNLARPVAGYTIMDSPHNQSLWRSSPLLAVAISIAAVVVFAAHASTLSQSPPLLQTLYILAATCLVTPYLLGHRLLPLYVLLCAHLAKIDSRLPLVLLAFSWLLFLASLYIDAQFLYLFPLVAWVVAIAGLHKMKGAEYGYSLA